jgi:hypothetical protein
MADFAVAQPKKGDWYLYEDENTDGDHRFVGCYAIDDDYYVEVFRAPNLALGKSILYRVQDLSTAIDMSHAKRQEIN